MKKINLALLMFFLFPSFASSEEISPEEFLDLKNEELTEEQISDYSDIDKLVYLLRAIEQEVGLEIILTRNVSMADSTSMAETVDSISRSLKRDLDRLGTELVIQEKEALESIEEKPETGATKSKVVTESRKKLEDIESKISRIEKMLTDLERRKKYIFNPPSTTKQTPKQKKLRPKNRRSTKNSSPVFVYEEDLVFPSRSKPASKIKEATPLSPIEAKRASRKKKKSRKPPQSAPPAKTRTRKR